MRVIICLCATLLIAACSLGGGEGVRGYPRLSEVPERPEPVLTPERSDELIEELREAGDEADAHAAEGRPDTQEDDARGDNQ